MENKRQKAEYLELKVRFARIQGDLDQFMQRRDVVSELAEEDPLWKQLDASIAQLAAAASKVGRRLGILGQSFVQDGASRQRVPKETSKAFVKHAVTNGMKSN